MKAVILAAGYATRLYPLTKNVPKSLLCVGGRTIIDFIIEKIEKVEQLDEIFVVANHCFYRHFVNWAANCKSNKKIKITDDLTTSNENRLGALADLALAIIKEKINTDILVMAGDNLFDFELTDMVKFYDMVKSDVITAHRLNDIAALQRTGVAEIDGSCRVISFEEKPSYPKSSLAVPPFYIFTPNTAANLVGRYLSEGGNPDAPGNFIPWLIKQQPVYAFMFEGSRYDIGTIESYNAVKSLFERQKAQ